MLQKWLREPLLHFLVIGLALFALYATMASGRRDAGTVSREVVVTQGRIRSLGETFARQWNRPPSQEELDGLVAAFLREEVLMREAQALGLDRDDTIVRRRLAQKMEFLTEDLLAAAEPTEDTLRAYLASHPERFAEDDRVTFSQIFLDPTARGGSLEQDASKLLSLLNGPNAPAPALLGDSRMLEPRLENLPRRDVEAQFGAEFAAALEELPEGQWHGPLPSGYGVHLVRVEARTTSSLPPFDVVREDVAREWSAAKRVELREAQYRALLARYRVTVEPPTTKAAPSRGGGSK
jgi:PPIC-type PPIASE domain